MGRKVYAFRCSRGPRGSGTLKIRGALIFDLRALAVLGFPWCFGRAKLLVLFEFR